MTTSSNLQATWDEAAPNPDPEADLGYKHDPLTVIRTDETDEKYIFLPGEEDHLTDTEFLIASPGSVRDLEDCR